MFAPQPHWSRLKRVACLTAVALVSSLFAGSVPPWSVATFPHEAAYQMRVDGMLERFASRPIEERAMAESVCPDTGKPVYTWALEGETIHSPYTGRAYVQGPTGYFGPRAKNEAGEVTAFGGDPLKHTLAYAVARFLLGQEDEELTDYLGMPGSLRQQYHFAAVNWGRFWPQFHEEMSDEWNRDFLSAVAAYSEARRPSDGYRKNRPIRTAHDLIGNPTQHLGGGGTENHMTMWRTTALLYSEILPSGSLISGRSLEETGEVVGELLGSYVERLYHFGSGEYSSSIYYPYSLRGFLNLYDFSPRPETKALAKAALDYYVATYALTQFNGLHAGAQRRGYPESHGWSEMDRVLWAWEGAGTRPLPDEPLDTFVHQVTSDYRPNRVVSALASKEVPLPYEAWINHPTYDMAAAGHHLEYFYCDEEFALSSVQLDSVNNSGQQTTWVLALRGDSGDTVTVTGGQPRWIQRGGHSPYDQYVQRENALLYMMDQTGPGIYSNLPEPLESHSQILGHLTYDRYTGRAGELRGQSLPQGSDPEQWQAFLDTHLDFAGTWIWLPRRDVEIERVSPEAVVFRCGKSRVFLYPFGGEPTVLDPDTSAWQISSEKEPLHRLREDRLLVLPGAPSGFALEVRDAATTRPGDAQPQRLDTGGLDEDRVAFVLEDGRRLELRYQARALRPKAFLDEASLIPDAWQGRGHIDAPFLKVREGVMTIGEGADAYRMDVRDPYDPRYNLINVD